MKKKIAILGSTGSIGKCLIKIIEKDLKSFNVILLTANKNYRELFNQAKKFNVKNLIISDYESYCKAKTINKNNNFRIYNNFNKFSEIFKTKVDYSMSAIVGLPGLEPTINIIKYSKTIAIANKESIICGWNLIKKMINKHDVKFVPVDSEHFSIWSSINSKKIKIDKIYLTASGGPFYKRKFSDLENIKISQALKHPTWKMGKKISIDSATLINKIFEVIEASKIFDIELKKIKIILHPSSYVHALIKFSNGLINIIAHDTSMKVPIFNTIYWDEFKSLKTEKINFPKLNSLNFINADKINFPLLDLIKRLPIKDSLFETVIVSANDCLVKLFLDKKIKFTDISKILLKITNMIIFKNFKKKIPKKVSDIIKTKDFTEKFINDFYLN
jgi:1-deoxy-D-xylulose-5-phosphate reductoisomerase